MIKYLKSKWMAFIVGLFVIVFGANTAMAASLSQVTAVPDSNNAGATANYTIRLQTANPINPGGLIRVDYPAGFSLSNVELGPTGTRSANLGTAGLHRFSDHVFVELGADSNVGAPEIVYFQLRGVVNTTTAGNYQATIQTLNPSMGLIDGPNLSEVFSIVQTQTLHHFAVSPTTTSTIVGQNVTLTITAQDVNNSTVTSYSGTPVLSGLTTSPNSTVPYYGPVSFSSGVASVTVRSYSAQSGQSVTVTDSGKTGNSGAITFSPSSLASIRIEPSQSIQTITAGTNIQFTAQGSDAYGNVRSGDTFAWTGTNSTGLFNTRTVGNYTIYASSSGINSNQVAVGVTHAAANSVTISPAGPLSITADQSQAFSVNATDIYGNTWNATSTAVYNENDPAGSFTANTYNAGRVGSWTLYATVDGINSNNVTANVSRGVITSISITPVAVNITADQTQQYVATASDADGNTWDISSAVTWSENDPAGTINGSGLYSAGAVGTWTITAVSGTVSGNTTATITHGQAVRITITPDPATAVTGSTVTYTAGAADVDGNSWNVTSTTSFNITNGAGGSWNNNVYTSANTGTWIVTGTYGSLNDTAILTVTSQTPVLTSIVITPGNQTITAGQTIQFTAVGYDQFGSVISGVIFTWTGTNSSGLFTNTTAGVYTIRASSGSVNSNFATVTVNPAGLSRIQVEPSVSAQSITAGQTIQFSAIGYDSYNNPLTGYSFTWYNTTSTGLFNNTTAGTYNVYASYGSISSNIVRVSVVPNVAASVTISPSSSLTIASGSSIIITATVRDVYGNLVADSTLVNWSRSNSTFTLSATTSTTVGGIATVTLISSNISGQSATVTASANSISSTSGTITTISVPQVLSNWRISNPGTIQAGVPFTITIAPLDQFGNVITNYNWSNLLNRPNLSGLGSINGHNPTYEFILASGGVASYRITTYKAESATIVISLGSVMVDSPIFGVTPASTLASIVISPFSELTITTGQTIGFTANSFDQYGNLRSSDHFTWTGTENSNSGLFNNVVCGKYLVYATSGSMNSNSVWVTVAAKEEPKKEEPAKKDESADKKGETKTTQKITKWVAGTSTAKAAETEKEDEEQKETGQAVEMATETFPSIAAETTEKPTRNWWIPVIIIILVLAAAYYGYVALAGRDNKEDSTNIPKRDAAKNADKKVTKINDTDTKEIKPIDKQDDSKKTRW